MKARKKAVIAILLIVSVFCSSCSNIFGNKLKPKRIIKLYQDAGYELVEIDDILDGLEDFGNGNRLDDEIEDGAYALAESTKEIKRIFSDCDGMNIIPVLGLEYDKNMQEACWFIRLENNYTSGVLLSGVAIQFDSEKNAINYLDNMADSAEDSNGNSSNDYDDYDDYSEAEWEYDSGEDGSMRYIIGQKSDEYYGYDQDGFMGIYVQGRYVFIIVCADLNSSSGSRELEDICELIGIESPTDM